MTRLTPQELSDRQLADIVRYFARLCLEAERGLRPPAQIERFMDPAEAIRSRGLLTLGRFPGGPIEPADVGQAHVARQPDGSVIASVVTRTEGKRWGALSFKLRPGHGLWRITDVRRLLATNQRAIGQMRQVDAPARAMGRNMGP